jgi:stress-induced morphogen
MICTPCAKSALPAKKVPIVSEDFRGLSAVKKKELKKGLITSVNIRH